MPDQPDQRQYAKKSDLAAMLGVTPTRIDQIRREMGKPYEEGKGGTLRFFCLAG